MNAEVYRLRKTAQAEVLQQVALAEREAQAGRIATRGPQDLPGATMAQELCGEAGLRRRTTADS